MVGRSSREDLRPDTGGGGASYPAARSRRGPLAVAVELDAHRARQLAADRVLAPVEAHEQRPPEGLAVAHLEALAGRDAAL